jgi:hypothetical protein
MKQQLRNTRENHLLTYRRKTQTIIEWSEQTGLPKSTILSRLIAGDSDAQALRPITKGTMSLTFKGKTQTVREWSKETGLPIRLIRMRMFYDWPAEKIFTQEKEDKTPNIFTFNGEAHTITEWAAKLGCARDALEHRVLRGWPIEKMLTQPFRKRLDSSTHRPGN